MNNESGKCIFHHQNFFQIREKAKKYFKLFQKEFESEGLIPEIKRSSPSYFHREFSRV